MFGKLFEYSQGCVVTKTNARLTTLTSQGAEANFEAIRCPLRDVCGYEDLFGTLSRR